MAPLKLVNLDLWNKFVLLFVFCLVCFYLVCKHSHYCGWSATEWLFDSLLWNSITSKLILNPCVHILICNAFRTFFLLICVFNSSSVWMLFLLFEGASVKKKKERERLQSGICPLSWMKNCLWSLQSAFELLGTAPYLTANKKLPTCFFRFSIKITELCKTGIWWEIMELCRGNKQTNKQTKTQKLTKRMLMISGSPLAQDRNHFLSFFFAFQQNIALFSV